MDYSRLTARGNRLFRALTSSESSISTIPDDPAERIARPAERGSVPPEGVGGSLREEGLPDSDVEGEHEGTPQTSGFARGFGRRDSAEPLFVPEKSIFAWRGDYDSLSGTPPPAEYEQGGEQTPRKRSHVSKTPSSAERSAEREERPFTLLPTSLPATQPDIITLAVLQIGRPLVARSTTAPPPVVAVQEAIVQEEPPRPEPSTASERQLTSRELARARMEREEARYLEQGMQTSLGVVPARTISHTRRSGGATDNPIVVVIGDDDPAEEDPMSVLTTGQTFGAGMPTISGRAEKIWAYAFELDMWEHLLASNKWVHNFTINNFVSMLAKPDNYRVSPSGPSRSGTSVYFVGTKLVDELHMTTAHTITKSPPQPPNFANIMKTIPTAMEYKYVFVPQNIGGAHWVFWLLVLEKAIQERIVYINIVYYDSMDDGADRSGDIELGALTSNLRELLTFMARESGFSARFSHKFGYRKAPQEMDANSCGLYVMRAAAELSARDPSTFQQNYADRVHTLVTDYAARAFEPTIAGNEPLGEMLSPRIHSLARTQILPHLWRVILGRMLFDWYYKHVQTFDFNANTLDGRADGEEDRYRDLNNAYAARSKTIDVRAKNLHNKNWFWLLSKYRKHARLVLDVSGV